MDSTKYMVIIKNEYKTEDVTSVNYNPITRKQDVTFYKSGNKIYSYAYDNIEFLKNPINLNPKDYHICTRDGKELYNINSIYEFGSKYWHIVFDTYSYDYKKSELIICNNCLSEEKSKDVFEYLSEIAKLSSITNDYGEQVLRKYYSKTSFIGEDVVLSLYLDTSKHIKSNPCKNLIFPFGCNRSQYHAVQNALSNQLSVIQGPPGTGKTQTILNIISNLIINNKTVIVVSYNNSAIDNVLEKLSADKYAMNFMVASLGKTDNKINFIDSQTGKYPDLSSWKLDRDKDVIRSEAAELANKLQYVYELQETIANLKQEKYDVEIEKKHFLKYADENAEDYKAINIKSNASSERIMSLISEVEATSERGKKLSLIFKLKSILLYRISNWEFYKQDLNKIITVLKKLYYDTKIDELERDIKKYDSELDKNQGNYVEELTNKSLECLKAYVADKYAWDKDRIIFDTDDLFKNSKEVLKEYPIVLSTTFSAVSSLNQSDTVYDYIIMDEASQVDLATGALALSCAKNAVIVGDLKQLPDVISSEDKNKADVIRSKYNLNEAYDYSKKSFLQSIVDLFPDVPSTLLREHYRCHPRIIQFCNQKFYNNELVIMTEDDNKGTAIKAIKTVEGNHARDNYNQRQIDVIKEEVLPTLEVSNEDIGIIAPYNNQVNNIRKQIPDVMADTVHKFQGREKDVIILSTVDNQIKDFTDDPNLLNVAVSRAKKKLIVIVSGNEQEKKGNVTDLVSYIQYNGMEVVDSKVYSIFDYLYSQYKDFRWNRLKKNNISQYDSEKLTYSLILEVLSQNYPEYGVVTFYPLSNLIRDLSALSEEELKYALNPNTHLDFVIYNKINKQPVLVVETDGYSYHKEGTKQFERDQKKNHILEVCGIKALRLKTNESGEKQRILSALT